MHTKFVLFVLLTSTLLSCKKKPDNSVDEATAVAAREKAIEYCRSKGMELSVEEYNPHNKDIPCKERLKP